MVQGRQGRATREIQFWGPCHSESNLRGGQSAPSLSTASDDLAQKCMYQKYASDPRPPTYKEKYEQTSGHNMTPNASKQGKFGSLGGHVFVHMFALYVGGWGREKESPM